MSAINKSSLRVFAALLISPLSPGIIFFILSLFMNPGEGLWALKISALMGYPSALLLGVPTHLFLIHRNWTGGWYYTIAGMMIGVVVSTLLFGGVVTQNFSLTPDPNKSLAPSAAIFILMALFGAFAAWIFWLIARPNRKGMS